MKSLILSLTTTYLLAAPAPAGQTVIAGESASGEFGKTVTVLPNGNFVVTDPGYDAPGAVTNVGAVYLYNGVTLSLISKMTGSSANDRVGINGVTVLADGDFVILSPYWNGVGAATWCSRSSGTSGPVSAANSLTGSSADDFSSATVSALANGNFLVKASAWDNGAVADCGAVTWCAGDGSTSGFISASNSLVGTTASDRVGSTGILLLANGNYVVGSAQWDNGGVVNAGAATWGSGASGVKGPVSAANSLVGTKTNDSVSAAFLAGSGLGMTALTNGNYVVGSAQWDNGSITDAGAATWCDGSGGTVGAVSTVNSLVGSHPLDQIGLIGTYSTGIIALSNGNYVVASPNWDLATVAGAGAVTWGNGTGGTVGEVSTLNSLVGSNIADTIGTNGVVPLANGNYVVASQNWKNGTVFAAGAVTWVDGGGPVAATVSTGNSLVGNDRALAVDCPDLVADPGLPVSA